MIATLNITGVCGMREVREGGQVVFIYGVKGPIRILLWAARVHCKNKIVILAKHLVTTVA